LTEGKPGKKHGSGRRNPGPEETTNVTKLKRA
jgi:hypothetical protein